MHRDNYLVTLSVPLCQTEQALELHQCASTVTKIHTIFVNDGGFHGTVSKLHKSFRPYPLAFYFLLFQTD